MYYDGVFDGPKSAFSMFYHAIEIIAWWSEIFVKLCYCKLCFRKYVSLSSAATAQRVFEWGEGGMVKSEKIYFTIVTTITSLCLFICAFA